MSRNKKRVKSTTCPNCHEVFVDINHNFCPFCGQENHTHKLPVKHFVMETLESLTHFDTKFLTTLKDLVLKPGLVIKNYNSNKRARYVPPIRMYVFTTFVFLLIVSLIFNHTVEDNDEKLKVSLASASKFEFGIIDKTKVDSLTLKKLQSIKKLSNSKVEAIFREANIQTNWINTRFINSFVKLQTGEMKTSELYKKFIKYASYSFFIFMPFFALILKLFYFRRDYYYSEFLVFSIFYHTFIFGLLAIVLLLDNLFNINHLYLIGPFFIVIFTYLGISLKKVFEGGWLKTIFKTSILSFAYLFCLCLLFVFLVLGSMI
jgi:hypothetical protein